MLRHCEEEEKEGEVWQETLVRDRTGNDGLSEPLPSFYCWARNRRNVDTVPVAWAEPSATLLRSHARVNLFPNAERGRGRNPLPEDEQF